MNFQEALQAIHQDQIAPIYYLHGNEAYLYQHLLTTIKSQLASKSTFDLSQFDLNESSLTDILDEAESYSFLADYRLILVNNAQFNTNKDASKQTKLEIERFMSYLAEPNHQSILVFHQSEAQIDQRKKIFKTLDKEAKLLELSAMKEQDVETYVKGYLQNASFQLSKEAFLELLARSQYNLTIVMHEIEKLGIYAQPGQSLGVDLIRQLVPRTLESNVFELTDAVLNGRAEKAIQIYQDLLQLKSEPIALHALLISQMRLILQVSVLREEGLSQSDIKQYLNIHPYRVKLAAIQANAYSQSTLIELYQELVAVDYAMKTGVGKQETYFYILLTKIQDKEKTS